MRKAGDLPNEKLAQRFADFLLTEEIETRVEQEGDVWPVWIIDEKDLRRARDELEEFLEVPDDPLYVRSERQAAELRREKKRKHKDQTRHQIDLRSQWQSRSSGLYPITLALIGLSIAATLVTGALFPSKDVTSQDRYKAVKASLVMSPASTASGALKLPAALVKDWEVWRLITPIFPHGSPMHLAMNMMMLFYLGQLIEIRRGVWLFLALVLGIAVLENLATYYYYYFTGDLSVNAIGISGVVYGLFGYAWVKSTFDRTKGIFVSQQLTLVLMGWLFLCMTGLIPNIANAGHVSGLLFGAAISYVPILWNDYQSSRRGTDES